MNVRLRERWDELRGSYWFVPTLMIIGAALLWAALGAADQALYEAGVARLPWLYYDTIEAARTLMFAVAGAMIGIIGVVFSITTVPLTIAASQFGPRLLRMFLRDTGTQVVLGTFTATFIFCMLVLLRLRDETTASLPQLALSVGLALALLSLGLLVYFINHIAVSMQAPNVVAAVSDELQAAIQTTFPLAAAPAAPAPPFVPPAAPALTVLARRSGYIQARDDNQLFQLAEAHDLTIQLLREPGAFVTAGAPLARVWPSAAPISAGQAINSAFVLEAQRTLVQDIEFGINELVEVALRALSPAINDPFTAMTCTDWLGAALCQLAMRQLHAPCRCSGNGTVRLASAPLTFGQATDAAFSQIREYGRGSASVTLHLLTTIAVVAECARSAEQRAHLLRHVHLIGQGSRDGLPEAATRAAVAQRCAEVAATLEALPAG